MKIKIKIIAILTILVLISCKKEEFTIDNLNGNKITALGHAGMGYGSTYPLDSYESILKCLNLGMDGTEFDVQMTRDSVLVAYHDIDLADNTNYSGYINSFTWDELKDAYFTQTPYLNYSIASIDQLFSTLENIQQYTFTFDCKFHSNNQNVQQLYQTYKNALVRLVEKYNLGNNVCIESHSTDFLDLCNKQNLLYKLFIVHTSFDYALQVALAMDLYGISLPDESASSDQIKKAHENNIRVAVWGVRTKSDNIDAVNKSPDYIQTDEVKHLLKLLK